jgi:hypothetical protein
MLPSTINIKRAGLYVDVRPSEGAHVALVTQTDLTLLQAAWPSDQGER